MQAPTFPIAEVQVEGCKGLIGLHPCPGKRAEGVSFADNLDSDVQAILYWGGEAVLTMMEPESLERDGASNLGEAVVRHDMQWFHLPITDNDIPDELFEERWPTVLARLNTLLDQGKRITMHCRGGTGRTSLAAAMLLLSRGEAWSDVERKLKAARPNALTIQCHLDYLKQKFDLDA